MRVAFEPICQQSTGRSRGNIRTDRNFVDDAGSCAGVRSAFGLPELFAHEVFVKIFAVHVKSFFVRAVDRESQRLIERKCLRIRADNS